jgi:hypothetical protein
MKMLTTLIALAAWASSAMAAKAPAGPEFLGNLINPALSHMINRGFCPNLVVNIFNDYVFIIMQAWQSWISSL